MPADHETIRIWGLHGGTTGSGFFLFREVLGGGGPGRPWADGSDVVHVVPNSRNLPAEFSETRYPVLIEKLALATDSCGAGLRRGGCGYDKQVRVLEDSQLLSNADRALISTYGVNGGLHGGTYGIKVVDNHGEELAVAGMSDNIPVTAGSVVRIVTTGGGGWGDPLDREADWVRYDVECGLVSVEAAAADYGVVVVNESGVTVLDESGTNALRSKMRGQRDALQFFDRGPHFEAIKRANGVNWPDSWNDPDDYAVAPTPIGTQKAAS